MQAECLKHRYARCLSRRLPILYSIPAAYSKNRIEYSPVTKRWSHQSSTLSGLALGPLGAPESDYAFNFRSRIDLTTFLCRFDGPDQWSPAHGCWIHGSVLADSLIWRFGGGSAQGPLQARSHAPYDLYWEPGAWERAWSGPWALAPPNHQIHGSASPDPWIQGPYAGDH